ncbi:hypothetical protein MPSEU_000011800 [Mayamaea pseudoterrestris]|nr:hypothetical protein MPSEU_000011800 [Mayamaea pseudoterrestris]
MFQNAARRFRRATIRTVVGTTVVVGGLEYTTRLPSQGRSSEFYHKLSDDFVTPLMRRLLDPEVAHQLAILLSKKGLSPIYHPSAAEQQITASQTIFGLTFSNPVGLAAGFDKDGKVIQEMLDLGFGFVEIGTVTPQPQPGNAKPRMYRLVEDFGIINRYGFNSQGTLAVKEYLEAFRRSATTTTKDAARDEELLNKFIAGLTRVYHWLLPPHRHQQGVIGVNIGKNKTTEDAAADYEYNIYQLGPLADFMVINISSPNTPGLRDLQTQGLEVLLARCLQARDELENRPPLLVKLSPDLSEEELQVVALTCRELGVDGLVVSNTTVNRPEILLSKHRNETGGLSGKPISSKSTECIRQLYRLTDGSIPIIGVGGVGSGRDAFEKLRAGASLVEVYSMMVYQGPGVVSKIRKELAELMMQHDKRRIEDVVGMDHEDIFWRRREAVQVQSRRHDTKMLLTETLDPLVEVDSKE